MANKRSTKRTAPALRALIATMGVVGKEIAAMSSMVNERARNAWYIMSNHDEAKAHRARILDSEGYENGNTSPKVFIGTFAALILKAIGNGKNRTFTVADLVEWSTATREEMNTLKSSRTASDVEKYTRLRAVETWYNTIWRWSGAGLAVYNGVDLLSVDTVWTPGKAAKLRDCETEEQCRRALMPKAKGSTGPRKSKEEKRAEALKKARAEKKKAKNNVEAIGQMLDGIAQSFDTFDEPERASILQLLDSTLDMLSQRNARIEAGDLKAANE